MCITQKMCPMCRNVILNGDGGGGGGVDIGKNSRGSSLRISSSIVQMYKQLVIHVIVGKNNFVVQLLNNNYHQGIVASVLKKVFFYSIYYCIRT